MEIQKVSTVMHLAGIVEYIAPTSKIAQVLPNMDGTAEYGRGHDGPPQDGYRGTKGYWVSRILPAGAPWGSMSVMRNPPLRLILRLIHLCPYERPITSN